MNAVHLSGRVIDVADRGKSTVIRLAYGNRLGVTPDHPVSFQDVATIRLSGRARERFREIFEEGEVVEVEGYVQGVLRSETGFLLNEIIVRYAAPFGGEVPYFDDEAEEEN